MCIIVYKPRGVAFPDMKTLERCFENNSDGAGFAYPTGFMDYNDDTVRLTTKGRVSIRKGFMTFAEFEDGLKEAFYTPETDTWKTDVPVVFHFRIRTHGKSDAGATQPIAVSSKVNSLRGTSVDTSVAVAHNGIITNYCDAKSKLSDSQLFAKKFLTAMKLYQDITIHKCNVIRDVIGASNKMVIMNGSGEVGVIGTFYEHEGCFYSNYSFQDYTYKTASYYDYKAWSGYYNGYRSNQVWQRKNSKEEHGSKQTALIDEYDI